MLQKLSTNVWCGATDSFYASVGMKSVQPWGQEESALYWITIQRVNGSAWAHINPPHAAGGEQRERLRHLRGFGVLIMAQNKRAALSLQILHTSTDTPHICNCSWKLSRKGGRVTAHRGACNVQVQQGDPRNKSPWGIEPPTRIAWQPWPA